jgi:hypothetical protein
MRKRQEKRAAGGPANRHFRTARRSRRIYEVARQRTADSTVPHGGVSEDTIDNYFHTDHANFLCCDRHVAPCRRDFLLS